MNRSRSLCASGNQQSDGGTGKWQCTVQDDNRASVDPQLVPGDHFHNFLECAEAAREDDEAAGGELGHAKFALSGRRGNELLTGERFM